ncbi:hypothetical protein ACLKA6_000935 [Drosophila palustris]
MLTAKLKIDGNVFITDTLIVGDNLIKENVLLGQDILCRKGSKLVIEGEECVLENVNEITTGNDLNELQQQRVNEVVQRNEQCFADDAKDLGKCSIAKMEIKLTTDVPVSIKPYRTPFALRPVVRNMISELLEADIIRQSDSPYASGIVMVKKANGEYRLCVDNQDIPGIQITNRKYCSVYSSDKMKPWCSSVPELDADNDDDADEDELAVINTDNGTVRLEDDPRSGLAELSPNSSFQP